MTLLSRSVQRSQCSLEFLDGITRRLRIGPGPKSQRFHLSPPSTGRRGPIPKIETYADIMRRYVYLELIHGQRDVTPLSPPYVVSVKELIHKGEQRLVEDIDDFAADIACRDWLDCANCDNDAAEMAGRRRECGPGGNDNGEVQQAVELVQQAIELVRDTLLCGVLTGDGLTHFVSGLPAGV